MNNSSFNSKLNLLLFLMVNLHYLKYFYDAVQHNSVSQSAKINYVSSPAVSQAIKWLENYYQIQLIKHGKNKFELTQTGIMFAEESNLVHKAVKKFDKVVRLKSLNKVIDFKFGVQQSIANVVVAKVIKNLSDKFQDINVKVRIGTSNRCKYLFDEKKIDFALSINNVAYKANSIIVHRGKFILVSSVNDKRSLSEAGVLITGNTKEVIEFKSSYFKKFNKELPVKYSISSWGVIGNLAIEGNGVAYIPDYFLMGHDKSSYRIRKSPVKSLSYEICFYYSKDTVLTDAHHFFIDEVKMRFNELTF